MKTNTFIARFLALLILVSSQVSCSDYLDILPKGQKIPVTLADFEAMLNNEGVHCVNAGNAIAVLNDVFYGVSDLNYFPLSKANYMWDESADRIYLNSADEGTYYSSYAAISTFNLIIENAPTATECTDAERNEVIAYAKVLRDMDYFNLVNYYADTYQASTASQKKGVPLITSAKINAPHEQLSIQGIYDFILNDLQEALPYIPSVSPSPLHPNLGTVYAFTARVYLQMSNYPEALKYADKALAENDELYDWTAYYDEYQTEIEDPDDPTPTPSPAGFYFVENYNFRHGVMSYMTTGYSIPVERKARFEDGDARGAARWKLQTYGAETYCTGTTRGYLNEGGITTPEVYLIKAECLARSGRYADAMDILNKVREKRILADKYTPRSASTEEEAIEYIRLTKDNELILTLAAFGDARRYNLEPKYARTLTKVVDGKTYTLSPTSHLWTMPFPGGAIKNPGNGIITQNVDK